MTYNNFKVGSQVIIRKCSYGKFTCTCDKCIRLKKLIGKNTVITKILYNGDIKLSIDNSDHTWDSSDIELVEIKTPYMKIPSTKFNTDLLDLCDPVVSKLNI